MHTTLPGTHSFSYMMWPGSCPLHDDSILKTRTYRGLKALCHPAIQGQSEKGQHPKRNGEVGGPCRNQSQGRPVRESGLLDSQVSVCTEKDVRHLWMESREAEVAF